MKLLGPKESDQHHLDLIITGPGKNRSVIYIAILLLAAPLLRINICPWQTSTLFTEVWAATLTKSRSHESIIRYLVGTKRAKVNKRAKQTNIEQKEILLLLDRKSVV